MIRVGILGARGYTARELIKLLVGHPHVEVVRATSRDASATVADVHPELIGQIDLPLSVFSTEDFVQAEVECVFSCLPHAASATIVKELLTQGIKVVDFSADYRLNEWESFEEIYGTSHPDRERVGTVPYGLPELFRDKIRGQNLIANPGCFPTSAILPIAPLITSELIEGDIIVDSKSGISGAGRNPKPHLHFPECNDSVAAYAVGSHRHQPEIQQIVQRATGVETQITFAPHLIPMDRGILSTIYLRPTAGNSADDVKQHWAQQYETEPFIRIREQPPSTKDVIHSNFCDLFVAANQDRIIVIAAIDNLIKGASGAAVQNFNLMFGHPETMGLMASSR